MSESTVFVGCHLDPWSLQLTTACKSQMSATVSAGDWLAECCWLICCSGFSYDTLYNKSK